MKIKIKTTPDDFIVHEIVSLPLSEKGTHGVYLLQKRGWNTVDLLYSLAKRLDLKPAVFSYGGRKDRHARTLQYIAIEHKRIDDIIEKDFSLKFHGYMTRPMGPDLIVGNDFQITVRQLPQSVIQKAVAQLPSVEMFGLPNYFDDQRFGSFDQNLGFLAEKILLGHFNGALKIYLTFQQDSDCADDRARKQYFLDNWSHWDKCLDKAVTDFEKDAFAAFQKKPTDYIGLFRKIPRLELSLFYSAYQSFLWNEVVRRFLKEKNLATLTYPGKIKEFLFYDRLDPIDLKYFERLQIPLAASNTKMPDVQFIKIFNKLLEERYLKLAMFNMKKIRHAFFKASDRYLIVKPQHFSHKIEKDPSDPAKGHLVLKFFLLRGSYATMFLKRIFASAI